MSVNVIYYFILLYTYEINKTRIHIGAIFPCMGLPLTPVGALNKNQWQNVALSLKTTNADSVILVFI